MLTPMLRNYIILRRCHHYSCNQLIKNNSSTRHNSARWSLSSPFLDDTQLFDITRMSLLFVATVFTTFGIIQSEGVTRAEAVTESRTTPQTIDRNVNDNQSSTMAPASHLLQQWPQQQQKQQGLPKIVEWRKLFLENEETEAEEIASPLKDTTNNNNNRNVSSRSALQNSQLSLSSLSSTDQDQYGGQNDPINTDDCGDIGSSSDDDGNTTHERHKTHPSASPPLLKGGILLIPHVISPLECQSLRTEVDEILAKGTYDRDGDYEDDIEVIAEDNQKDFIDNDDDDDGPNSVPQKGTFIKPLRRVSLCDMSSSAKHLYYQVLMKRILPTLQYEMPGLLDELGLDVMSESYNGEEEEDCCWTRMMNYYDWATDEPSINRYTKGGKFDPHRDGYALTVIILLSEDDKNAFEGGGTKFFKNSSSGGSSLSFDLKDNNNDTPAEKSEQGNANHDDDKSNKKLSSCTSTSVVVKPPQGTAVLFDGDITHAGCPVTKGTRHLLVASFSSKSDVQNDDDDDDEEEAP